MTDDLPNFEVLPDSSSTNSTNPPPIELEQGRSRMPTLLVFVLFLLRGWIGGPNTAFFRLLLPESKTLGQLYDNLTVSPPASNTISEETSQFCLRCELDYAKENQLDDFSNQRADSTAIHANSVYATESTLMSNFLNRAEAGFNKLAKLDLHDFTARAKFGEAQKAIEEIEQCSRRS